MTNKQFNDIIFSRHTHAELVNEENPNQIVYKEKDVLNIIDDILNSINKRDYFIGMAIQGLCSTNMPVSKIHSEAIKIADKTIALLNEQRLNQINQ
jgi:hypothetical protein